MLNKDSFRSAIKELGIQNKCVEIHSSFRSFGCHVDGGAQAVMDAFLAEGCTILVITCADMYEIFPPQNLRPKRNGSGDYSHFNNRTYDSPKTFSIASNNITKEDMGIIPYTLLNMPSRKRGYNPLNSFAAVGNLANELVREQSETDVFAPLRKLYELEGYTLMIGVDLKNATIIHFAEQVAGRIPFVRGANNLKGEPSICNTGGCSNGFNNLSDKLKSIEKNITVGNSYWRCFPTKRMVDISVRAMLETPEITHCSNSNCDRCNDAILGGPIWE